MAKPIDGLGSATGLYDPPNRKYFDPGTGEHMQDRIAQDRFGDRAELSYPW